MKSVEQVSASGLRWLSCAEAQLSGTIQVPGIGWARSAGLAAIDRREEPLCGYNGDLASNDGWFRMIHSGETATAADSKTTGDDCAP